MQKEGAGRQGAGIGAEGKGHGGPEPDQRAEGPDRRGAEQHRPEGTGDRRQGAADHRKEAEIADQWGDFKQHMAAMQELRDGGSVAMLSAVNDLYELLTFNEVMQDISIKTPRSWTT